MDYLILILIIVIIIFGILARFFKKRSHFLYNGWSCLMWLCVSVFIVRAFFWEPYINIGPSMYPTIPPHSVIIINKKAYGIDWPFIHIYGKNNIAKRDQIIAFRHRTQVWIKRVIGLPGDTIFYNKNGWYINGNFVGNNTEHSLSWLKNAGKPFINYYSKKKARKIQYQWKTHHYWKIVIPKNFIFVMGDNRNESTDSRDIGLIPMSKVLGKVIWHHST